MDRRPQPALLGSLIALMVASWAFNFPMGKIGLRHLAPLTLASFRVMLAGFLMLPAYLIFRPRAPRADSSAPDQTNAARPGKTQRARFPRRDFWMFGLLGVLGVCLNQICFTVGLNYTTVGHAALIIGTGPILVLLLAWMQGLEALRFRKALGMGIAFSGVATLAVEHGIGLRSGTLRGDLITFAGSVAFALYTVLGKRFAAKYDSISLNAFTYFAGTVLVAPLAAHEALQLTRVHAWGAVGWAGWLALAYMAVFGSVVAYLIYFWVLRYMTASRLSAFSYLHPVFSTLLGIIVLGEKVTPSLLAGGTLVLAGVYLIEAAPRENQRAENNDGE